MWQKDWGSYTVVDEFDEEQVFARCLGGWVGGGGGGATPMPTHTNMLSYTHSQRNGAARQSTWLIQVTSGVTLGVTS